jgi:hypothetical protein
VHKRSRAGCGRCVGDRQSQRGCRRPASASVAKVCWQTDRPGTSCRRRAARARERGGEQRGLLLVSCLCRRGRGPGKGELADGAAVGRRRSGLKTGRSTERSVDRSDRDEARRDVVVEHQTERAVLAGSRTRRRRRRRVEGWGSVEARCLAWPSIDRSRAAEACGGSDRKQAGWRTASSSERIH